MVESSILNDIKQMIGPQVAATTEFDVAILGFINMAISTLAKVGVGPPIPFMVMSDTERWIDYVGESTADFSRAKGYIYIQVKLLLDPPTSSYYTTALTNKANELLWYATTRKEEDP